MKGADTMFKALLKEVGRGKRGARDLSYEEALEAADWIINQKATPAQIGAFFIAQRIKMESIDELKAFTTVCRQQAYRVSSINGIDCTGPYDGRTKTFFATFATAFVLAEAGLPVTLHSSPSIPPKNGITLHDMLTEIGVDFSLYSKEMALSVAERSGLLYVPAQQWLPAIAELRPVREQLDMRTILNTVEKLIDYAQSPYLVFGVFHNTVFNRMSELLQDLGYKRALIVQGAEGSEDLFIDRPTRTFSVEAGKAELQIIDPELYGLETAVPDDLTWTVAKQVSVTEEVLQGKGHTAFFNQVLLNAAARLHVAGKVNSIEQGIYICRPILENGTAWQRYNNWKQQIIEQNITAS